MVKLHLNLVRAVSLFLWAIVLGSSLENCFATATANLDQGQNGTPDANAISPEAWINGNVNASKAHYVEGYSVSYRMVITGIANGPHELQIGWDIRKSGKSGLDYITDFNRLLPHNQFG